MSGALSARARRGRRTDAAGVEHTQRPPIRHLPRGLRECLIFFAFLLLTALMTWPWATRLRDAVADNGDSYAFVWSLWWNYHQTLHDPLHLFHANIFFPYRYTLAFTEHGYGVALLFFPLLAAGLRPITVYSVATLCAFAFCGYGAFRLTRTLTDSYGAAWVAGIFFAFVPYHFLFITALPYLFAGWTPLLLEALVLFARRRTWRRAAWLGFAFLMSGLTCINWLLLSLVPFALSVVFLAVRHPEVGRARAFWVRGSLALVVGALLLMPFIWPYYMASKLYGFRRDAETVVQNSASRADWLTVPAYNKVWGGMGSGRTDVIIATLFPGLTALLLALAALIFGGRRTRTPTAGEANDTTTRKRWLAALDALAVVAGCVAAAAAGFSNGRAQTLGVKIFGWMNADYALLVLAAAFCARLCIAYPRLLRRGEGRNLVESLRSARRSDAFWLGALWAVYGFVASFGMSVFFYRLLYANFLPFQSVRGPCRAAMMAYVGLAILAGLGADTLVQLFAARRPRLKPRVVYAILCGVLLFELHAAPMPFVRGIFFPDAVSLRLKETPMRGGIVELPSLPQPPYYSWHMSMLRATDHARPVVSAAASFIPPLTMRVHELSSGERIPPAEFLDLLEQIPASYVVYRARLAPEVQEKFAPFFKDAEASGRLRLVAAYDDGTQLYAVTKTEPAAQADANIHNTPAP
jgi:hypothetical protein